MTLLNVLAPEQAGDVAAVVAEALPEERLTSAELIACLWDDTAPTLVLGSAAGDAVAAAVVRDTPLGRYAAIQLLAVAPLARRQGRATALLEHLHGWAFDEHEVAMVSAGGGSPFYLWPGIDAFSTPALCLFERLGYEPSGIALNMSYASTHRAAPPPGLTLSRPEDPAAVSAALDFVSSHWPHWAAETGRALDRGSCVVAVDSVGAVAGFACHSVNRAGWLGPMGTDPVRRHGGLGTALLGAIAEQVQVSGLGAVEISWLGPVGFYANAAGASVSRVFQSMRLYRPG